MATRASIKDDEGPAAETKEVQPSQQQQQTTLTEDNSDPLLEQVRCRIRPLKMTHWAILIIKIYVQKCFIILSLSISADMYFAGTSFHPTDTDYQRMCKTMVGKVCPCLLRVSYF